MSQYIKRPQKRERVLQSIFDSVNSIIDYLPTITVRGDNYSTYVEHSTAGTIIHAKQSVFPDQTGTGGKYYAGSGIAITSGNFINALLSAGPNINIDYNSGWLVISGTPAGSGSSSGQPPSNGRFNTIGAGNSVNSTLSGCGIVAANLGLHIVDPPPNYYITINETPSAGYNLISSDLTRLTQLYNYDLVSNSQADIGSANMDHYVRAGDLFINSTTGNRGLGTQINFYKHSIGNTVIDPQTGEQHLVNPIMGLKVDLTITGGTWMGVSAVPRQVTGFDVDPEELEINCLLTGTYDHYPHTSGFIDIVPVEMEDGKTWGVISTNLHAGSGIAIDAKTGEITCTVDPGGGGGGGLNIVYITTQDQRVVVPNTKYCLIPITSLSTNVIDFPNMNPTAISSFETDNNERIYKYFFHGFQSRPDYLYETTSARIDGDVKYGAYDPKNNNWYNYMKGDFHFGNIFIFEPQQQDCVVEIDCGIGGNSLAIAPSGLVWSTFSNDVISGTPQSWYEAWRTDTWPPQKDDGFLQNWRIELAKGTQYLFIYDHNTNMWNMIAT